MGVTWGTTRGVARTLATRPETLNREKRNDEESDSLECRETRGRAW